MAKNKPQPLPITQPMPKLKDYDRITVIFNLHHEHRGEPPKTIPLVFSRMLKEKQEPYQRRINVADKWQAVDLGWVPPEMVGCVVIENLEGRGALEHSTDEERRLTESKVVEVSYTKNSAECDLIPSGAGIVKWPADAAKLYYRCQNGTASCRIHVISK